MVQSSLSEYFNTSGRRSGDSSTRYSIAEGEVPPSFGSVTAVKIVNHIENQNWVIIDEVSLSLVPPSAGSVYPAFSWVLLLSFLCICNMYINTHSTYTYICID